MFAVLFIFRKGFWLLTSEILPYICHFIYRILYCSSKAFSMETIQVWSERRTAFFPCFWTLHYYFLLCWIYHFMLCWISIYLHSFIPLFLLEMIIRIFYATEDHKHPQQMCLKFRFDYISCSFVPWLSIYYNFSWFEVASIGILLNALLYNLISSINDISFLSRESVINW